MLAASPSASEGDTARDGVARTAMGSGSCLAVGGGSVGLAAGPELGGGIDVGKGLIGIMSGLQGMTFPPAGRRPGNTNTVNSGTTTMGAAAIGGRIAG
jgi:hypothetical protein